MVDVIISGEGGKLHAVYHKSDTPGAPVAVVLSGNPRHKCHMNDRTSYAMFRAFMDIGFSVVRFNYRGVNDSEGSIGTAAENMLDIATVIDWIQNKNEDSNRIWRAGNQMGAWYVLQAMMRRPEVSGFVLVSPDTTVSDFQFLSPRPNRGLLLQDDVSLVCVHGILVRISDDGLCCHVDNDLGLCLGESIPESVKISDIADNGSHLGFDVRHGEKIGSCIGS